MWSLDNHRVTWSDTNARLRELVSRTYTHRCKRVREKREKEKERLKRARDRERETEGKRKRA